ncbi:LytTR family DNA-binding domain-containing protein [Dyadobacter sp. CY312]|uniref:LytR/AlgR family response regulator transcription factor n=1 Tax=Dyadobacter sp. CY312 TaxID=2907303 RepID=UPI001F48379D|nr:LytTR family DNA-binding domain-containing protein [Dyadobacter sp. CY312]MCE7044278.1 LytTR family DNA-binding domain-containing protein [Dyadobacter sp. CY312]
MKCIAIDDEPLALELLKTYISGYPELNLLQTFDDAFEGADYLKNNAIDLLFIDINMPDISGIELVTALDKKPLIIFTTAYKKFAHQGFELEAIDYLLKPITPERFQKAVSRATQQYHFQNLEKPVVWEPFIVRSEYKMIKIEPAQVEYIEAMQDYIKIFLKGVTHPVLTLMSLKIILEKLPQEGFSRVHRSFIVADSQVKSILNKKIRMITGKEIPISDSYLDFIDRWKSH